MTISDEAFAKMRTDIMHTADLLLHGKITPEEAHFKLYFSFGTGRGVSANADIQKALERVIEHQKKIPADSEAAKAAGIAFIMGDDVDPALLDAGEKDRRIRDQKSEIKRLKTEGKQARRALFKLVVLKDHKEEKGKDDYYEAEKPKAWEEARDVLNDVKDGGEVERLREIVEIQQVVIKNHQTVRDNLMGDYPGSRAEATLIRAADLALDNGLKEAQAILDALGTK